MYRTENSSRMLGLAVTTAMAGALLAGCTGNAAPVASVSAEKSATALAAGKHDKAISYAEAAVLAEPRAATYRASLGAAYMDAGRFSSAVQSFDDALTLGDASARTKLSLALALMADGRNGEALAVLDDGRGAIAASDLGLAYALAGKPGHGIDILSIALREGENTPKVRQNLAYAYALNGQWREARVMAAEDVPANQLPDRMEEWAATVHPAAFRHRVAVLLGVPADAGDPGQPVALALNNFPTAEQLAAEATADDALTAEPAALAAAPESEPVELAPLGEDPVAIEVAASDTDGFDSAFKAPAAKPAATAETTVVPQMVSRPVVQGSAADAPVAAAPVTAGSHLVQLGSFSSEANAERAWGIYQKRYPELANHAMVITEAVVQGKRYWRVSAAGFGSASAKSMCGKVTSGGKGCIAYASARPLPGAVETGTRLASR